MREDDEVCLCFHVSLRKIRAFLERENPPVPSLISECLSAGTGCGWCVPFLKHLHTQHTRGQTPDMRVSPEEYARTRQAYKKTKVHDETVVKTVLDASGQSSGTEQMPSKSATTRFR